MHANSSNRSVGAIILAAGKGTRLKSDLPKVLHPIGGRPMLAFVIDACRAAGVARCVVVVGHGKQLVIDAFSADDVEFVEQTEQLGTGHAAMVARDAVLGKFDDVLVLCGDGPLIRADTLVELLDRHRAAGAAATLATAVIDDPTGYGRIARDADGALCGIVEHNDCSAEQLKIGEVNPSYYCFRTDDLFSALDRTSNKNAKGEYYITDTLSLLIGDGLVVSAITAVPPGDIYSINSRADLAMVGRVMRDRINSELMDEGVTLVDPDSTWIDPRASIGVDTIIHPFTVVSGAARIGAACVIGPFAHVDASADVPDGSTVVASAGVTA